MDKKERQRKFIEKAKELYGDKYDYSKVEYVNNQTNVCVICDVHGEFYINPKNHLKGYGCKKCSTGNAYDNDSFIEKARLIHGDKYDYSKVEYVNAITEVCIVCPEHGEFWMIPHVHLRKKYGGCSVCRHEESSKIRMEEGYNDFINRAKMIHGDKYDYSKVEYVNSMTPVCIICPIHGEFWQTPNKHISCGHDCPKCSGNAILTNEEFILKAKQIHGNKYDYSKTDYIRSFKKVIVTCKKHGDFSLTPNNHLRGKGCPICQESSMERTVRLYLENNCIRFEQYKRFDWLGRQSLDFYLPDYNIAIECQGIQHFKAVGFGSKDTELTENRFKHAVYLDNKKLENCREHGIVIYYINYDEDCDNKVKNIIEHVQEIQGGEGNH